MAEYTQATTMSDLIVADTGLYIEPNGTNPTASRTDPSELPAIIPSTLRTGFDRFLINTSSNAIFRHVPDNPDGTVGRSDLVHMVPMLRIANGQYLADEATILITTPSIGNNTTHWFGAVTGSNNRIQMSNSKIIATSSLLPGEGANNANSDQVIRLTTYNSSADPIFDFRNSYVARLSGGSILFGGPRMNIALNNRDNLLGGLVLGPNVNFLLPAGASMFNITHSSGNRGDSSVVLADEAFRSIRYTGTRALITGGTTANPTYRGWNTGGAYHLIYDNDMSQLNGYITTDAETQILLLNGQYPTFTASDGTTTYNALIFTTVDVANTGATAGNLNRPRGVTTSFYWNPAVSISGIPLADADNDITFRIERKVDIDGGSLTAGSDVRYLPKPLNADLNPEYDVLSLLFQTTNATATPVLITSSADGYIVVNNERRWTRTSEAAVSGGAPHWILRNNTTTALRDIDAPDGVATTEDIVGLGAAAFDNLANFFQRPDPANYRAPLFSLRYNTTDIENMTEQTTLAGDGNSTAAVGVEVDTLVEQRTYTNTEVTSLRTSSTNNLRGLYRQAKAHHSIGNPRAVTFDGLNIVSQGNVTFGTAIAFNGDNVTFRSVEDTLELSTTVTVNNQEIPGVAGITAQNVDLMLKRATCDISAILSDGSNGVISGVFTNDGTVPDNRNTVYAINGNVRGNITLSTNDNVTLWLNITAASPLTISNTGGGTVTVRGPVDANPGERFTINDVTFGTDVEGYLTPAVTVQAKRLTVPISQFPNGTAYAIFAGDAVSPFSSLSGVKSDSTTDVVFTDGILNDVADGRILWPSLGDSANAERVTLVYSSGTLGGVVIGWDNDIADTTDAPAEANFHTLNLDTQFEFALDANITGRDLRTVVQLEGPDTDNDLPGEIRYFWSGSPSSNDAIGSQAGALVAQLMGTENFVRALWRQLRNREIIDAAATTPTGEFDIFTDGRIRRYSPCRPLLNGADFRVGTAFHLSRIDPNDNNEVTGGGITQQVGGLRQTQDNAQFFVATADIDTAHRINTNRETGAGDPDVVSAPRPEAPTAQEVASAVAQIDVSVDFTPVLNAIEEI